jgi:hypothetical protein
MHEGSGRAPISGAGLTITKADRQSQNVDQITRLMRAASVSRLGRT